MTRPQLVTSATSLHASIAPDINRAFTAASTACTAGGCKHRARTSRAPRRYDATRPSSSSSDSPDTAPSVTVSRGSDMTLSTTDSRDRRSTCIHSSNADPACQGQHHHLHPRHGLTHTSGMSNGCSTSSWNLRVYMRYTVPGCVRPALPARCAADARDTHVVIRRDVPNRWSCMIWLTAGNHSVVGSVTTATTPRITSSEATATGSHLALSTQVDHRVHTGNGDAAFSHVRRQNHGGDLRRCSSLSMGGEDGHVVIQIQQAMHWHHRQRHAANHDLHRGGRFRDTPIASTSTSTSTSTGTSTGTSTSPSTSSSTSGGHRAVASWPSW